MSRHLIKNYRDLASTKLRRDALGVLEAGLRAIDTRQAIRREVQLNRTVLTVGSHGWDLAEFKNVYVIGIGKAAFDACAALEGILGSRIVGGVVLDVKAGPLKRMKSVAGSHPFPSLTNMQATGEIIALLKHLSSRDLLIVVVSGGGSALLCWPYQLKCDDLTMITQLMMSRGATIREINTVRKHLSEIQGGQFARLAHPATVLGLIFSDVPGDDLDMVASGPTVLDTTTVEDAARILSRYDVLKTCRMPDCELKETPKDPVFFKNVTNILLVNNQAALLAMEGEALKRGYGARMYSNNLVGEARDVGKILSGLPRKNEMVLAAGETTVTLRGKGKGGRNQELALGALASLDADGLVLSCASDGIDNTSVAGAIADARTREAAKRLRMDPERYLRENDSFSFFRKTKDHLVTGVTGANVSDLMIAARV